MNADRKSKRPEEGADEPSIDVEDIGSEDDDSPGNEEYTLTHVHNSSRTRRLGRYMLSAEIASGGMATLYLARSAKTEGFSKLFAVKVIHEHLAKEEVFVKMFLEEARIASRISHPNVCGVFDFGKDDGTYFLVMEYLAGVPLSAVARKVARQPPKERPAEYLMLAARVIAEAAEGLHAAHTLVDERGVPLEVVHRDVSPHNIFVTYDGGIRVLDFGIARAVGRDHQTATGIVKGKFRYMAPEQLSQEPLNHRTDIWALGVCLWEMLTLRRLFSRESHAETLTAVLNSRIPRPSEVRPNIPEELDRIVMRALCRSQNERYQTARQMARDLNSVIASEGGISTADVADWMTSLFGKEISEHREMLDRVARAEPHPSIRPPHLKGLSDTGERSMPDGSERSSIAQLRARKSRKKWLRVLALLGAMVGAFTFWSWRAGVFPFAPTQESAAPANSGQSDESAQKEPTKPAADAISSPVSSKEENTETRDPDETTTSPDTAQNTDPTGVSSEQKVRVRRVRKGAGANRVAKQKAAQTQKTTTAPSKTDTATVTQTGMAMNTVSVATPPGWAEIYVNGMRVGRSPTRIRLTQGRHTISLFPYGEGPSINRVVDVPATGLVRLVVRLDPEQ